MEQGKIGFSTENFSPYYYDHSKRLT